MDYRKWNWIVASAFIFGGTAVASFNYLIDPYEVFGHQWLRSGYAVNERYRKVEHILTSQHGHDSYIVGSSVMGVYDPSIASQLTGRNYYNLSFLAGTPKEAHDALRAIKAHGLPIKEVLFGVDFFTFYEHPRADMPMGRQHPAVTGESRAAFFASYLFSAGLWQGANRIYHHFQPAPSIYFDVDGGGNYHLLAYDRRIAADHGKFIAEMFPQNQWSGADVNWLEPRFAEFEAFCRWLDSNGIKSKIFVHPFYSATLDTVSQKSYAVYMGRLRKIRPDIVDFSGRAGIVRDPHWYYDKRHYRPVVANQIMKTVLGGGGNDASKLEALRGL